jgi:FtsP/CotA-like multicopper oxidase with cupredoxin domain
VTISVTNVLGSGRTISLESPGIGFSPGATDAPPGETVARTFTATAAGTYLYTSGGAAGRQQAMGMYGALVIRPTTAGQAYDGAASAFDAERTMVLSELDPVLNRSLDPQAFDLTAWHPTYWLINGRAHPQTGTIDVQAGKRLLLRYVNAGLEHATMTMLGLHARLVGADAHALDNPYDVVAQTVPAGATADGIVAIAGGTAADTRYPLYNRQLNLTNGDLGDPSHSPGGMMTFIRVVP